MAISPWWRDALDGALPAGREYLGGVSAAFSRRSHRAHRPHGIRLAGTARAQLHQGWPALRGGSSGSLQPGSSPTPELSHAEPAVVLQSFQGQMRVKRDTDDDRLDAPILGHYRPQQSEWPATYWVSVDSISTAHTHGV